MHQGDVSVLYAKLFFEALVARDATSVRDTAARARTTIVDTIVRAPATSDANRATAMPSSARHDDGHHQHRSSSNKQQSTTNSQSPIIGVSSPFSEAHRALMVATMLQYLVAIKSSDGGSSSIPGGRVAGADSQQDELYRMEAERVVRESETEVIHVLISFIVSSPSSTFTDEVKAAFTGHLEFLLFCAVAQHRSLAAYGVAMGLPHMAALGGIVRAPSVSGGGTHDYPLPPESMDYFWLVYFVLLLLGSDSIKQRLKVLAAPLRPSTFAPSRANGSASASAATSDFQSPDEEVTDQAARMEGLSAVGHMITELCLAYSQVLTREVKSPHQTLAHLGLQTTAPQHTSPSSGNNDSRGKEVLVGDVLHTIRQNQANRLSQFPPPCLRQLLGYEPLIPFPSKKHLVVPSEPVHVLTRLSDIVALVIEETTAQSLLTATAVTGLASISSWAATLLMWLLRLSSFCFIATVGGKRGDSSTRKPSSNNDNGGEAVALLILAATRCADLLARISSAERSNRGSQSEFHGTSDGTLVMYYVAALQFCVLSHNGRSLSHANAAAAESAHRLMACVARQVVWEARRGSPSSVATTSNHSSERMATISLTAIANFLHIVDGVDSLIVSAPTAHSTSGHLVAAGVQRFVGLLDTIASEAQQAHLTAQHAVSVAASAATAARHRRGHGEAITDELPDEELVARADLCRVTVAGIKSSLSIFRLWLGDTSSSSTIAGSSVPPAAAADALMSSEASWSLCISALELSAVQAQQHQTADSSPSAEGTKPAAAYRVSGASSTSVMGTTAELMEMMVSISATVHQWSADPSAADPAAWTDASSFRALREALKENKVGSAQSNNDDDSVLDDPAPLSPTRSPRAGAAAQQFHSQRPRSASSGSAAGGGGGAVGAAHGQRYRYEYASATPCAPCSFEFGRSLLDLSLQFFSRGITLVAAKSTSTATSATRGAAAAAAGSPRRREEASTEDNHDMTTLTIMAESFAQLLLVAPDAVGARRYAKKLMDDVCALRRMAISRELNRLDDMHEDLRRPLSLMRPGDVERHSEDLKKRILESLEKQNALYSMMACGLE